MCLHLLHVAVLIGAEVADIFVNPSQEVSNRTKKTGLQNTNLVLFLVKTTTFPQSSVKIQSLLLVLS